MRCLPLVALLLAAAAPSAQALLWMWPAEGTPEPRTTSVPVAYAASLGATVGMVGAGLLLTRLDPALSRGEEASWVETAGYGVAALGIIGGPSVGTWLLTGDSDPSGARGLLIRLAGMEAGLYGLIVTAGCILGQMGGDANGTCRTLGYISLAAVGTGMAAGTVYDLARIPHNASRAREASPPRRAALVPAGRGLALRVPL